MHTRMALEMFFKAYAALKGLLTESEAKKIGHHLERGLTKMIYISGLGHLESVRPQLSIYPDISDRYKAQMILKSDLWKGFQLAQMMGAIVVRQFSDYDALSEFERSISNDN